MVSYIQVDKDMRFSALSIIIVGVLTSALVASAQMSSTNFEIRFDSVGVGGSDTASSATYELRSTAGNTAIDQSTSTSYTLAPGYREGIFDQVITFEVLGQTNSSQVVASSLASTTITVASTAGYAVGDFIVLIQDEGASQVSAVGKITSIGAGTLTVDELKDGGVAPVIDGTNDFVYELSSVAVNLDDLDAASVNTAIVGFNVSIDVDGGYSVQVLDDGNLRDGANDIDDVADGTVTAGAEEYGGRSSDTSLSGSTFDTSDTAFTTSFQDVADEGDVSFESRNFVTLKASIDGATSSGSYAHIINFVVSGNY